MDSFHLLHLQLLKGFFYNGNGFIELVIGNNKGRLYSQDVGLPYNRVKFNILVLFIP